MMNLGWKSTNLFKTIQNKNDVYSKSIITLLENPNVMEKIETILDKSSTTPKDFTLHDSDHSFRVAQRIWELIPEETKIILSSYELGFLLLSSYLHDIGMSPDFDIVERHLIFLNSYNKNSLSDEEILEFQKWIDSDEKAKRIDIKKEKIDNINELNYILTYYIRHKHNDWSGQWITNNLSSIILRDYPQWINDLIKLCKSHHYGIEKLLQNDFDPKPIGDFTIHIRYLSMCLRIADVMENDPDRTPEVLLKHRGITEMSRKYWIKDHFYNIIRDQNKFTIYSRPERAYIHNAIEQTANIIENELKICSQLIIEKPLNYSTYKDLSNYIWILEPILNKDIKPKDGLYEYIQGAFKPNTSKILELLGGNQLYGNPIWAVRELLQNSFDAIKEKIAYQILTKSDDIDKLLETLGNLNEITISLHHDTDGFWLICKDSGVGMTKEIIEHYFLESGASKRHEIIALERKCKERGFNFGRTGQFGIGVLSYFMLAEKIVIHTKREQNTGYNDNDSISWRFEINGTHDFGELTKSKYSVSGSEIRLKLKKEIEDHIEKWDESFAKFLTKHISKTPCSLVYISLQGNTLSRKISTGWTNSTLNIKDKIVAQLYKEAKDRKLIKNEIISSKKEKEIQSIQKHTEESLHEMSGLIDFLYDEGDLMSLGRYRIHIPYFKLSKGNSFYYLREDVNEMKHNIYEIQKGHLVYTVFDHMIFSLKGFTLNAYSNSEETNITTPCLNIAHIEIDFEFIEESNLTISRHTLLLEKNFINIKNFIDNKIYELLNKNKNNFTNIYSSINRFIMDIPLDFDNEYWGFEPHDKTVLNHALRLEWRKIEFPLFEPVYYLNFRSKLTYDKKELVPLYHLEHFSGYRYFNCLKKYICYFKIGFFKRNPNSKLESLPIATKYLDTNPGTNTNLNLIELPKGWENILFFSPDILSWHIDYIYINKSYVHIALFDSIVFNEVHEKLLNIEIDYLDSDKKCFSFLLSSMIDFRDDSWIGFCEKKSHILKYCFKILNINEFYIYTAQNHLVKISLGNYSGVHNEEKRAILPEVTDFSFYLLHK